MALGSTQPLVKMSTRNIPGGKSGRCVRLTTSSPPLAECHEIWEPKPPGTLWATPGLLRDCFTFTFLVLKSLQLNDFHTGLQYFIILICNIYKAFDEALGAVRREMGGNYWNTG
jgi:hypothetical protein